MEEILHHLGCKKPYKEWDKLPDLSSGAEFLNHQQSVDNRIYPPWNEQRVYPWKLMGLEDDPFLVGAHHIFSVLASFMECNCFWDKFYVYHILNLLAENEKKL